MPRPWPWLAGAIFDKLMSDMLKSIGIEKGKPFNRTVFVALALASGIAAARAQPLSSTSSPGARSSGARLASPSGAGVIGATHAARPDAIGRARRAVTDGNGFVFINHVGQICPSGFLPLPVGNVRDQDLATVYREDPLFRALRDPARLGGRC